MKTRSAVLAMLLMLSVMCGNSFAERHTFGPDFQRFSLEIPDGWKINSEDTGVILTSSSGRFRIVAIIVENTGASAVQVARQFLRELRASNVTFILQLHNMATLSCTLDGKSSSVTVSTFGDAYMIWVSSNDSAPKDEESEGRQILWSAKEEYN